MRRVLEIAAGTGVATRALAAALPAADIVAIDLNPGAVKEVREELEFSGINEYTLFPDFEGLARHLRKKYKIR